MCPLIKAAVLSHHSVHVVVKVVDEGATDMTQNERNHGDENQLNGGRHLCHLSRPYSTLFWNHACQAAAIMCRFAIASISGSVTDERSALSVAMTRREMSG